MSSLIVSDDSPLWGIDGSIVLYGLVCDVLLIVPLLMYLTIADASSLAQYHQTYINMLFSAFAPFGITWWIVLVDDSQAARTALSGAIELAGLGPFALLWVGMSTYLMSAKALFTPTTGTVNIMVWVWAIIYPIFNIIMIIFHYHVSPPMYAWIEKAPLLKRAIDNPTPWAQPI